MLGFLKKIFFPLVHTNLSFRVYRFFFKWFSRSLDMRQRKCTHLYEKLLQLLSLASTQFPAITVWLGIQKGVTRSSKDYAEITVFKGEFKTKFTWEFVKDRGFLTRKDCLYTTEQILFGWTLCSREIAIPWPSAVQTLALGLSIFET